MYLIIKILVLKCQGHVININIYICIHVYNTHTFIQIDLCILIHMYVHYIDIELNNFLSIINHIFLHCNSKISYKFTHRFWKKLLILPAMKTGLGNSSLIILIYIDSVGLHP